MAGRRPTRGDIGAVPMHAHGQRRQLVQRGVPLLHDAAHQPVLAPGDNAHVASGNYT